MYSRCFRKAWAVTIIFTTLYFSKARSSSTVLPAEHNNSFDELDNLISSMENQLDVKYTGKREQPHHARISNRYHTISTTKKTTKQRQNTNFYNTVSRSTIKHNDAGYRRNYAKFTLNGHVSDTKDFKYIENMDLESFFHLLRTSDLSWLKEQECKYIIKRLNKTKLFQIYSLFKDKKLRISSLKAYYLSNLLSMSKKSKLKLFGNRIHYLHSLLVYRDRDDLRCLDKLNSVFVLGVGDLVHKDELISIIKAVLINKNLKQDKKAKIINKMLKTLFRMKIESQNRIVDHDELLEIANCLILNAIPLKQKLFKKLSSNIPSGTTATEKPVVSLLDSYKKVTNEKLKERYNRDLIDIFLNNERKILSPIGYEKFYWMMIINKVKSG